MWSTKDVDDTDDTEALLARIKQLEQEFTALKELENERKEVENERYAAIQAELIRLRWLLENVDDSLKNP